MYLQQPQRHKGTFGLFADKTFKLRNRPVSWSGIQSVANENQKKPMVKTKRAHSGFVAIILRPALETSVNTKKNF